MTEIRKLRIMIGELNSNDTRILIVIKAILELEDRLIKLEQIR